MRSKAKQATPSSVLSTQSQYTAYRQTVLLPLKVLFVLLLLSRLRRAYVARGRYLYRCPVYTNAICICTEYHRIYL